MSECFSVFQSFPKHNVETKHVLGFMLEKEMATHSNILAWRIPRTEEPGRIQSMGSQSWTRLSDSHTHAAWCNWDLVFFAYTCISVVQQILCGVNWQSVAFICYINLLWWLGDTVYQSITVLLCKYLITWEFLPVMIEYMTQSGWMQWNGEQPATGELATVINH